jgi:hypothetical protein
MDTEKSLAAGIKYGIMGGLFYVVLLYIQFTFGASNPIVFAFYKFITYIIILAVFIFAGISRRKELGGFANFKTIFQTLLVTIVITELFYALFNYIYLNYIDPQFMDNFLSNTLNWMENNNVPQEQIDKQFKNYKENASNPTLKNTAVGIGLWIIIDSIIGLIIAGILKKEKPVFDNSFNQP